MCYRAVRRSYTKRVDAETEGRGGTKTSQQSGRRKSRATSNVPVNQDVMVRLISQSNLGEAWAKEVEKEQKDEEN
jgi:hypothetical protein